MKTMNEELLTQLEQLQAKTMTKREAMAAQIMSSLVANASELNNPNIIAKNAVFYADMLLKELGESDE